MFNKLISFVNKSVSSILSFAIALTALNSANKKRINLKRNWFLQVFLFLARNTTPYSEPNSFNIF